MYRDTTNKMTVENSETDSFPTNEIENKKTSSLEQHDTMNEKTPDCVKETNAKENELLGFISWEYLISYLIYLILFGIGSFTPHVVQLWMDFVLFLSFSIVCYISESTSNQWIVFLFLAFFHSIIHYIYPFLDEDGGIIIGISPFPDTLCHTLMFIYSFWFLGLGNLHDFIHFSKWKISNYFKIFWIICISGSLINIVATLLVYDEDEAIHFKQALFILKCSSIFQGISTGVCCSAAIVNPLNCKSRKMIEYHLIPWLFVGIIGWILWISNIADMEIVIHHGFIQFLFIYPLIASLSVHFYHQFISNKR